MSKSNDKSKTANHYYMQICQNTAEKLSLQQIDTVKTLNKRIVTYNVIQQPVRTRILIWNVCCHLSISQSIFFFLMKQKAKNYERCREKKRDRRSLPNHIQSQCSTRTLRLELELELLGGEGTTLHIRKRKKKCQRALKCFVS